MRIAISSKSGCGNTTVTTLVSEKLNYQMINFTFRHLAESLEVISLLGAELAEGEVDHLIVQLLADEGCDCRVSAAAFG